MLCLTFSGYYTAQYILISQKSSKKMSASATSNMGLTELFTSREHLPESKMKTNHCEL